MPIRPVSRFLDENNVRYKSYTHKPTYTAQETAEELHVSGYEVAKAVLLIVDTKLVMAVLPACEQIDREKVETAMHARYVDLASEEDIDRLLPECEKGCLPPIGNLVDIDVIVSPTLTRDELILFSAGSHTEDIRMSYDDWEALVQPRILDIAR
jgi:Ala-tRNA(Pro) deacylase